MGLRLAPIRHKAELLHDGELLPAELGEPLAHSLIADGRLALARSPKLHRPRGPYCLRAACDGCLVRVDGKPNVMACRHRVQGGESVETQNVLGTRNLDLLAATDFLFPHGIDHHRLLAGVRGVSSLVQLVARRVAGLGRLPDEADAARPAEYLDRAVLIVGGGGAGLAAAAELGPRALLVDDARELGGSLLLRTPARATELATAARDAGAELWSETTALGVYPEGEREPFGVLLSGPRGATFVRARRLLIASGGHDATPSFPGNDLPGVFSARAGLELLAHGIAPGRRVAVVGRGEFAELARERLEGRLALFVEDASVVDAVEGRRRVRSLRLGAAQGERRVAADALLYDAPQAPAFELTLQAGGRTRFEPGLGYVPELDAAGRLLPRVFCAGRVTGCAQLRGDVVARHTAAELSDD